MTNTSLPLVIYHANCADGFTAAWAVNRAMAAEFYAGSYGNRPPDVTGRDVIFVDFCYKPAVMLELQRTAASILVLDHHKSAAEDMPDEPRTGREHLTVLRMDAPAWKTPRTWQHYLTCVHMDRCEGIPKAMIYALFDQERSGAGIAWDFFHTTPRPALVNHVEDRDLWRFELPGTRAIQAAVFSYEYTFENWDYLAGLPIQELRAQGLAISRKHQKDIAELLNICTRSLTIGGHSVPAANLPHIFASDAGHIMAQGKPFAACYWDTDELRHFSLRSTDDGVDVSLIAKQYGGGGHRNAAGFRVPRDHELAVA